MSIFSNMVVFPAHWEKIDERPLTPDEKKQFTYAVVEDSPYGLVVHFKGTWEPEDKFYIYLDSDSYSKVRVGVVLPVDSIRIITLSNCDKEFIYRIKYVES